MTRLLGLAALALFVAGCATDSSVKAEIKPLADRITNVERQNAAMEAKLAEVSKKADVQAADVQAVRKDLADTNAAAQKAQQAAADAQAAATRAETAAAKAAKAFELRQMKGSK
jgi:uncharacterized protein (UPF0335 family)